MTQSGVRALCSSVSDGNKLGVNGPTDAADAVLAGHHYSHRPDDAFYNIVSV